MKKNNINLEDYSQTTASKAVPTNINDDENELYNNGMEEKKKNKQCGIMSYLPHKSSNSSHYTAFKTALEIKNSNQGEVSEKDETNKNYNLTYINNEVKTIKTKREDKETRIEDHNVAFVSAKVINENNVQTAKEKVCSSSKTSNKEKKDHKTKKIYEYLLTSGSSTSKDTTKDNKSKTFSNNEKLTNEVRKKRKVNDSFDGTYNKKKKN